MRRKSGKLLPHLRTDEDLRDDRSVAMIVVRLFARCVREMALAVQIGRGTTRIHAPYWIARYIVARATRPIRSEGLLSFTIGQAGRKHRTVLRKSQSDIEVWHEVFLDRNYDFEYEQVLAEVDVIVDLGANAGLAASYFQMRFPAARILAIEPLAENIALVRANADAIGANWSIEQGAVGAAPGIAAFYVSGYWNTGSLVRKIGEYRQSRDHRLERLLAMPNRLVDVLTIPQLLERHQIDLVSIMKMDIEGSEEAVLSNASAWLHRVGVLIVELHTKYFDAGPIRDQLRVAGFTEQPHAGPCAVFVNREFAGATRQSLSGRGYRGAGWQST